MVLSLRQPREIVDSSAVISRMPPVIPMPDRVTSTLGLTLAHREHRACFIAINDGAAAASAIHGQRLIDLHVLKVFSRGNIDAIA